MCRLPAMPLFRVLPSSRRRALISLTPLIDMVFILLVFFMLASSFQTWRAIAVTASQSSGSGAGQKGVLLVQVRQDGLSLGSQPMALEAIADQVARKLADNAGQRVLVEPVSGVSLQTAVEVLDRLAGAGVSNLSLTGAPGR
jgi:biopolymer transport protein ExbD